MEQDAIDLVLEKWRRQCPRFDAQPIAVVGRILRLAGILERRANLALKRFDLPYWAFDVLAALRREGKPYASTPTELMQSTLLSSGAMTNRIDRLESLGLVSRKPDPNDRRSLQVQLTAKGLRLLDKAVAVRMQEAEQALQSLTPRDRKLLSDLLRKLMVKVDATAPPATSPA